MSMSESVARTAADFRDHVKKMQHYGEALSLMYWDLRTGAPRLGVELRSDAIATLSDEVFRMSTSDRMGEYLAVLTDSAVYPTLDRVLQRAVEEAKREFERSRKVPAERNRAYVMLASQAESVWEEARAKNDFAMFRPYLEQIVAMKQEFIDYWGYQANKYDTLLDIFEPGVTVAELDQVFGQLRKDTVDLVQAIAHSGRRIDETPFERHYDVAKQREVSRILLESMGYDFAAGRLDETLHPFESAINRYDVRVTTKYLPNDVRSNIFSVIHEGGHALYEQGISPDLIGTGLCGGTSFGIHESQSRFWENMIGRTREFWEFHYPQLLEIFPTQLADVALEDFYRGVNVVRPSLIRIEADEVTYNLHIMIRYEIEKGLINGDLHVADLPGIWREKMHDYLGVTPDTDADGVLQDVHWSGGDFGYFPSYALGNIYAAQFRHTLAKEVPDYLEQVRRGNLSVIRDWLKGHIHQYGAVLKPAEIVQQVTGEPMNGKYLVEYLREKFGALYGV